jgi:hypothetical protein
VTDLDRLADQVLPYADTTRPDQLTDAVRLAAELLRRVNHHTLPHWAPTTLPAPQDVDRLLGDLVALVRRLPQLCRQASARTTRLASLPGIAVDQRGPAGWGAESLTRAAAAELSCVARTLDSAADDLVQACRFTARLYIQDPPASEGGGGCTTD